MGMSSAAAKFEPSPSTDEPTVAAPELGLRRCRTCGEAFPSDYALCPRDGTVLRGDNDDPLIGVILAGTYQIQERLGRGGMGQLYEATHTRMDRRFAVKVLREAHAASPDARARFAREARALSRIRSDQVLEIVDVLPTPDERTALITPLLQGEDLRAYLKRKKELAVAEAVSIAREICRGLAAVHAQGIIHRDLKPSNVFLEVGDDAQTRVKILDFGVAKIGAEPEMTRTGAVLGTPAYMAPEQARGSSDVDSRADVYAIGAVVFHMLTGRPPYTGDDATAMLGQLLSGPPPRLRRLNREVPPALEVVVQTAMARRPENRYSDVMALDAELAAFVPDIERLSTHGRSPEAESTLIVSRAAVERAEAVGRQARQARPKALLLSLLGSALAATVAVLAAEAIGMAVGQPELAQVHGSTAAFTALVGAFLLSIRAWGPRWNTTPDLLALNRRVGRGLTFAVVGFGLLSIAAALQTALSAPPLPARPLTLRVAFLAFAFVLGFVSASPPHRRPRRRTREFSKSRPLTSA